MCAVIVLLRSLLVAFLVSGPSAHAAIVPLFTKEMHLVQPPGLREWINRAASFHVWQNDDALRDLYAGTDRQGSVATGFCVPSAIGNALLREFSRTNPRASRLQVPGLIGKGAVDTAVLVRELGERCGIGGLMGSFEPSKSSECMLDLMSESGYPRATVRLIRNYGSREPMDGMLYEERAPDLEDLVSSVRAGYQAILSLSFLRWSESEGVWKKMAGHSVNVVGYGKPERGGDSKLKLYIQNPTRNYHSDFKTPVFDEISLRANPDLDTGNLKYSNIEVEGAPETLIQKKGMITVVSGLILINANPASLQGTN